MRDLKSWLIGFVAQLVTNPLTIAPMKKQHAEYRQDDSLRDSK